MAEAILNQPQFQDPDKAREYLEAQVWPNGRICPHCGVIGDHYVLSGKSARPGLGEPPTPIADEHAPWRYRRP